MQQADTHAGLLLLSFDDQVLSFHSPSGMCHTVSVGVLHSGTPIVG